MINFEVKKVGKEWIATAQDDGLCVQYTSPNKVNLLRRILYRHPGIKNFTVTIPNKEIKDIV